MVHPKPLRTAYKDVDFLIMLLSPLQEAQNNKTEPEPKR